jgi:hypothetical protein
MRARDSHVHFGVLQVGIVHIHVFNDDNFKQWHAGYEKEKLMEVVVKPNGDVVKPEVRERRKDCRRVQ